MEPSTVGRLAATQDDLWRAHPAWTAIRAHLEAAQRDLFAGIRAYPTPITGCDDQFNRLLERRDAVARELRRLDATMGRLPAGADAAAALADFVASSSCIDAAAARRILARSTK